MTAVNISYNRIVGSYDTSRGYPPAAAARIGAAIVARCGSASPLILELGIGTGRVAAPMAAAGARMVGIDIAHAMLAVARDKGLDRLAQADAIRLPLPDALFDAVLERLARRADLFSWALPDDLLGTALDLVRAWAERSWGDLDTPEQIEHRLVLGVARKG
jgi:predicted TPR repeat methyltransferase